MSSAHVRFENGGQTCRRFETKWMLLGNFGMVIVNRHGLFLLYIFLCRFLQLLMIFSSTASKQEMVSGWEIKNVSDQFVHLSVVVI